MQKQEGNPDKLCSYDLFDTYSTEMSNGITIFQATYS